MGASVGAIRTPQFVVMDGIAFGFQGDFCTLIYDAPPRYERMKALYDPCDAYFEQLEGTALTLQVVLPASTAPDASARAETRRRLATIDPRVRRLVTVAVGDDVRAAVVRVIMRGIFAISPRRSTRSVSEIIPTAVEHLLSDRSEVTPRRHELVRLVDACFDALHVTESDRALAFGNSAVRSHSSSPS